MHVGLNLLFLVPGATGGMEVYARELIPELVSRAPDARFTAFINREAAEAADAPWNTLIGSYTVPVRGQSRFERVRGEQQFLPRLAQRARIDLLHSLASTSPAWGDFPRVTTIHDLNYRIVPEAHTRLLGLGMRVLVPLAARSSQRIIVSAESARNDLVDLLGTPRERIDVVPLGVREAAGEVVAESEVRRRLGAGSRVIVLSASAKLPHKNLTRLLGAMALIPSHRRPLLVLPGYPTPHEAELARRSAELGLEADVRMPGWIERPYLEGLYAAATCFVFPSLYEGFGLPVLEAMMRGLPVAASGRGAVDEVAGEAALRFDPESEPDIAAAIERLINDHGTAERLKVMGLQQARRFSWSATAAGTLASYERTLSERA